MITRNGNWTLDVLLADMAGDCVPAIEVQGVCLDSRQVKAGDLYLAVGGATTHGLLFAESAVESGAVAVACSPDALQKHDDVITALRTRQIPVVVINELDDQCAAIANRFYGSPDRDLVLIAVTGTDGKTSVCRFVAQALSSIGKPCGYIGTIGWGLGDELDSTDLTTPDAVTLRRLLANMRDAGAQLVALEASSHGLAEGRLDGLAIDVAVLTNLGRDHLDYHKSIEAYRDAKARLFAWPGLRSIVVNGCDELGQALLEGAGKVDRYAYFTDACGQADAAAANSKVISIMADRIEARDSGLCFRLSEGADTGNVDTSLLGRFNVDNLLACYAGLRACGVAANEARHALANVRPVAGRMERFGRQGGPVVVVDFSHTPQALNVAIEAVRVHCSGRLWVVFGCGGDRDAGKRAPMAAAAEAADHVVLTDDNPRTERSEDIISDVMKGFRNPSAVTVIPNRAQAIEHAIRQAGSFDLVLIAGKGHEDYQIIGTTRHPFSDRIEVLSVLEQAS